MGCLPLKDQIPSYAQRWIRKHNLGTTLIVPRRQNCMTASGESKKCHWNVSALTQMYGGYKLRGLSITASQRVCFFTCHTVWITPESRIVDVTLDNRDDDFTPFIPFGISNQRLLSSVLLLDDYIRSGVLVNFRCDDITTRVRDTLNPPVTTVGCNEYFVIPASAFARDLFLTHRSDEISLDNDAFKVADFSLPSKFTGKYWSQIVEERVTLKTQSH